jgi:hypothetical protein
MKIFGNKRRGHVLPRRRIGIIHYNFHFDGSLDPSRRWGAPPLARLAWTAGSSRRPIDRLLTGASPEDRQAALAASSRGSVLAARRCRPYHVCSIGWPPVPSRPTSHSGWRMRRLEFLRRWMPSFNGLVRNRTQFKDFLGRCRRLFKN